MEGRKKQYLLFILFFLICCNKQQNETKNLKDEINKNFDLKKYSITKQKVNDSIVKIQGYNDRYNISGYLNTKRNKKDNWWYLQDKKDTILVAEYILFGNDKFLNQYKFFNHAVLDVKMSKFYKDTIRNNKYLIHFNLPQDGFKTGSNRFSYNLVLDGKIIGSKEIQNHVPVFDYEIDMKNYPKFDFIKGVFVDHAKKRIGDSIMLGSSQIYTEFYP
jgi:hypothetical protein